MIKLKEFEAIISANASTSSGKKMQIFGYDRDTIIEFCGPLASALLCFPICIAHWCWPALLATALGIAVSKENMLASYVLQFAILLVIMTNITQFFYGNKDKVSDSLTPTGLMVLSTLFISIAPLKNLCFNVCMQAFQTHGYDSIIEVVLNMSFSPLFSQRLLQYYTVLAYILMGIATFKQTKMFHKLYTLTMHNYKKNKSKSLNEQDTNSALKNITDSVSDEEKSSMLATREIDLESSHCETWD